VIKNTKTRREHVRQTLLFGARLSYGDQTLDCRVKNISAGGVLVEIDEKGEPPSNLTLQLGSFGEFSCELAWKSTTRVGLKFLESPEKMAQVIMGIATYA